jgi:hypothetical protein
MMQSRTSQYFIKSFQQILEQSLLAKFGTHCTNCYCRGQVDFGVLSLLFSHGDKTHYTALEPVCAGPLQRIPPREERVLFRHSQVRAHSFDALPFLKDHHSF